MGVLVIVSIINIKIRRKDIDYFSYPISLLVLISSQYPLLHSQEKVVLVAHYSLILPFLEFHMNGIISCVVFIFAK